MKNVHCTSVLLAVALAACAGLRGPRAPLAEPGAEVARGCPPERTPEGEVRLVFIGDSGYGTGSSDWGTPGQEAIAARIDRLALDPDLVFLLGDNIYWTGSASLYKTRYDDMYEPLIRQCKVHVALGNHDLKGCRAASSEETVGSCLEKLEAGLVADRLAQAVRQGMDEAVARQRAEAETRGEIEGPAGAAALRARRASCLPADASAFRDSGPGSCHASAALKHAQFGFGAAEGEGPLEERRQRYYSILWPVRKLTQEGAAAGPAKPALVEVVVLDSNTLDVAGGLLGKAGDVVREDRLQLLWLRSILKTAARRGEAYLDEPWRILAMHHPPFTPRACACRLLGHCVGGHVSEDGLQKQLRTALAGVRGPDLVMTAHNHIYARSHPLDAEGEPQTSGSGGVRYFVSGGGGAPLFAIDGPDRRFASALSTYHFIYLRLTASTAFFWALDADGQVRDSGCFDKGSNVDRPLAKDFGHADALPATCRAGGQ